MRRALAASVLLAALALAAGPLRAQTPGPSAAPMEQLVLATQLNTVAAGDLFALRSAGGDLLVRLSDLQSLGLKIPEALARPVDGEPYVPLRDVPGLQHRVDAARLVLELQAEPALLPTRTLQLSQPQRAHLVSPPGPTAFLNYALQAGTLAGGSAEATLTTEAGLRTGDLLLLSEAATVRDSAGEPRMVRLMSRAIRDDVDTLRRVTVGDFYSPTADLGTSVNLGGVAIAKQYGLDPSVLRQPLSNLRGQVAVPSDVEVLVDGQRVRLERVQPGEFQLRDLYGYGGARSVQLVVRDAFGRVQQLDYSVYFTDQPLRQGLHDYSYGAGLLRRGFGSASNQYGPAAFSGYHRYGLTDGITLGVRAEGRQALQNGGLLGTFVLGPAGVLSAAVSSSRAQGQGGWAGALAYNYQQQGFSAGLSSRRDSAGYASLGDPLTMSNRRGESTVYGGLALAGLGTFTLSRSLLSVHAWVPLPAGFLPTLLQPQQVSSLRYSVPLVAGLANLTVNLNRIRDATGPRTELTASVVLYFERDQSFQAGVRSTRDTRVASARVTRNPGIGEGFGYDLAVDDGEEAGARTQQWRAAGQVNAARAILRLEAERSRGGEAGSEGYRAGVAGALAFIDGQLRASRPIADSFALARVGDLPDVPVALNGTPMGRTDAAGTVLLPSLAAYYDNEISIDEAAIPIDHAIGRVSQRVAPLYRSGAVVDFGVTRVRSVTGRLVRLREGRPEPVDLQELLLQVGPKQARSLTGRGGELYFENLGSGRYRGRALPAAEAAGCEFELAVPESADSFLELGDVACR
ncbi:MAG TPA: fimbria/pilus outer membrane usher protein [Ramlibacter sp.]|jgi:outer membrane usher protein FimD/PapC|uniref:fimbria/pilus outer membrane usher protein n=1 Tax=Ramlibacter sp. TaxID=1917967 RepID=UPI002D624C25|nr:fimbria/pilus outer membrane usher protein [Ramlibacter sp.]HZY19760.1 fimbria/pilus outer membrane usher protein [Ramlibacter sp.]